jgi:hypothetical protein
MQNNLNRLENTQKHMKPRGKNIRIHAAPPWQRMWALSPASTRAC